MNLQELAGELNTSAENLKYYARLNSSQAYNSFEIPSRSGKARLISTPIDPLMEIQRRLLAWLKARVKPRNCVHGFRSDRNDASIKSNALCHVKKTWVFNVDLENFFPTITKKRIHGLMKMHPYNLDTDAANIVSRLCTVAGVLPQGSPTSPILANAIAGPLDKALQQLGKKYGCFYTRYADDLTFSTCKGVFPEALALRDSSGKLEVGEELRRAIENIGFRINERKVWLVRKPGRQMVTGLVVNDGCNVTRKFLSQLSAMMHAWKVYGYAAAEREYHARYMGSMYRNPVRRAPNFENVVRGKLAFLRFVKGETDNTYLNYLYKFSRLEDKFNHLYTDPLSEIRNEYFSLKERDLQKMTRKNRNQFLINRGIALEKH